KGIDSANFDNVERLMYIGSRGMGALEYSPDEGPKEPEDERLNLDELHRIAAAIIEDRNDFSDSFDDPSRAVMNLFLVGSSAGGARPKAILAWNPQTNEIRSGRAEAGAGFEYWLLKFDGVREFSDREFGEGLGYGKVEFAYHEMAAAAGINLAPARLLNEDGRSHFMTKRFDRSDDGRKTHMLTLAALCHYDFEQAGAYSYEQCFGAIRRMGLGSDVAEQQFRRMAFNAVARNQDDHVKNIAFLMDRAGEWSLSPAYDVTHSYKPTGVWTSQHQMSINGRRDGFERTDFKDVAETASMPTGRGLQILDEVVEVVSSWSDFAEASGVTEEKSAQVAESHRLSLGS
ncbi:MAG: type II toxin-antitoxin system HipA family toxin, partial [Solirubrobacterales bacterium]